MYNVCKLLASVLSTIRCGPLTRSLHFIGNRSRYSIPRHRTTWTSRSQLTNTESQVYLKRQVLLSRSAGVQINTHGHTDEITKENMKQIKPSTIGNKSKLFRTATTIHKTRRIKTSMTVWKQNAVHILSANMKEQLTPEQNNNLFKEHCDVWFYVIFHHGGHQ